MSGRLRNALLALTVAAFSACGELSGPDSPGTPTDVVATLVSDTAVIVRWTPGPLNDGVIGYTVYRNERKIGESTKTTFTDTELEEDTTYVYSVAANCKSGVISNRSAETSQSTVTRGDLTRPVAISSSIANGATGVAATAQMTVTFSEALKQSTVGTATVVLKVTTTGLAVSGTVSLSGTSVVTFTPASPLSAGVNYTFSVNGVTDLSGNLNEPFMETFTVAVLPPA